MQKKKKQKAQPSIKNKKIKKNGSAAVRNKGHAHVQLDFFFFLKKGIVNKGRRVHIAGLNGHLCPKSFTQFSLEFSSQIGKIVFWWVRRENS